MKLRLQTKYKNNKLFIAIALVLGIAVGLVIGYGVWHAGDTIEKALVVSVVDGDTIELEDGSRVRYLGIDTPETGEGKGQAMYYAAEATEFATQLALNKEVTVILDAKSPARDRYGRLLAHLQLEDGRIVNEELVRNGFAYTDLRFDNDRFDRYVALQNEALRVRKGLWKEVEQEQLPGWLQREQPGILDGRD